jgi:hypothetical protein
MPPFSQPHWSDFVILGIGWVLAIGGVWAACTVAWFAARFAWEWYFGLTVETAGEIAAEEQRERQAAAGESRPSVVPWLRGKRQAARDFEHQSKSKGGLNP